MPIYISKKGESGYSGIPNIRKYGEEIFSQNTFAPAHDKWETTGICFSFFNNILIYRSNAGNGGILKQNPTYFLSPLKENTYYEIEFNFQNVIFFSNLQCSIIGYNDNETYYDQFIPVEGINKRKFFYTGENTDGVCVLVTGSPDQFDILSISLKEIIDDWVVGYSGYSGRSGYSCAAPIKAAYVANATAETVIAQFNALRESLLDAGFLTEFES